MRKKSTLLFYSFVMSSALIYVIIAVMWGSFFLPKVYQRRKQASVQSIDKYRNALKMVSSEFSKNPVVPSREEKFKMLRRRRLAFAATFISFIGVSTWVSITRVGLIAELIPASLFGIYVINVRRQKISIQLRNRRLKTLEKIAEAKIVREETLLSISSSDVIQPAKSHIEFMRKLHANATAQETVTTFNEVENDTWQPLAEREPSNRIVLLPKGSAEISKLNHPSNSKNYETKNNETWNPVEVPLPSYLTAPKAVVSKRIIDLTVPGRWSSQEADESLDVFLSEQELLPAREDSFETDLMNEKAKSNYRAAGE